ncbi:MAG TPA: class A beta-lactamase [Parvibaculum sp.]|jgi:beta-lactamase class A
MAISRRDILLGSAALFATLPTFARAAANAENKLAALEHRHNGRLGVAILDTGNGKRLAHRAGERFGLCSTFKFLAAAAVLHRVDRGEDDLARRVGYGKADLLSYAPETSKHVGEGGMALGALCAAAVELSDNTAANLMLASLGGPSGVTRYARSLLDDVTRLDRTEPTLNIIAPGDPRDTTTPAAMLGLMQSILIGDALSPASRKQLQDWMLASKTGSRRIAAGLPKNWRIGDKTGTGAKAEANDIAIIWPPKRAPILVAAYYEGGGEPPAARDAVLADVGRLIAETFPDT